MKRSYFFVLLIVLAASTADAQFKGRYDHQYTRGTSTLLYSFVLQNDSAFIYGYLKEKGTESPINNINILLKDFNIGTVPDPGGNFRLFLPVETGTIIFDKTGDIKFEFPFRYKKGDLKEPSAHH